MWPARRRTVYGVLASIGQRQRSTVTVIPDPPLRCSADRECPAKKGAESRISISPSRRAAQRIRCRLLKAQLRRYGRLLLTALKRHFQSTPNNEHHPAGRVGPFRARTGLCSPTLLSCDALASAAVELVNRMMQLRRTRTAARPIENVRLGDSTKYWISIFDERRLVQHSAAVSSRSVLHFARDA